MKKIIYQLDLDAFFASVEENENPELKKHPIAVGHWMNGKGIITTANYNARKYGLHSAMPSFKAKQLCPDLILIESNYDKYVDKSEEVFTIVKSMVDSLEMASIDEAYADVTKTLFEKNMDPVDYARTIQRKILRETGLGISVGISNNRVMAKMASGFKKPLGIDTLFENELSTKLWPLDISELWYVGKASTKKFKEMGVNSIGDLAHIKPNTERWEEMMDVFGKNFKVIWGFSNGISSDKINESHTIVKSLGRGKTFEKYTSDYETIKDMIRSLSKEVSESLKYRGLISQNISFGYKSAVTDLGPRVPHRMTNENLEFATNDFEIIFSTAMRLFEKNVNKNEPIKAVVVNANKLEDEFYKVEQLTIWNFDDPKEELTHSKALIKELNSIVGYNAFTDGNAIGTYKRYVDKKLITGDNIKFKRWEK